MHTRPYACLRLLPLLVAASTAAVIAPAHASPPASCTPAQRAAAHLFLDIACTAPASDPGTLASACDAPHPHGRHLLGADLPITACARRLAWVLALFGQIMRPQWNTPDYRWQSRRFDRLVGDARGNDLPYPDLPQAMRDGFIAAVRGSLRTDDGPVPYVSVTPATDPRLRQPISAVGALGFETAADRYLGPSPAVAGPRQYGPPPAVHIDVDSPASIGVYGWDLEPTWPEPGPPLRWRASPGGMAWQDDLAHAFTHQINDSRSPGAPQPISDHPVLQQVVSLMDTWRLAPFTPYRDRGLPEEIRTLADAARQQVADVREAVREAARAPLATASVRHVYVIVRLAGGVEAVLHGSVGRFAPAIAEIHAIAVPARNVFPILPMTPVGYRQAAVRGATAVAIRAFVNHVQSHGATMLAYIGQDLPTASPTAAHAASPTQRTAPHDEP